METYREYPIRCKTCNEPLACYAHDFEALIEAGSSVENALNDLGITEYCSRIAMMNPTIVAFNMENREVIEGFKSVDAANEADAQIESTTRPVFNPCVGVQPVTQRPNTTAPLLTGFLTVQPKETEQRRVPANIPTGIQTIALSQPNTRVQAVVPGTPNIPTLGVPVGRPGMPTLQPVTPTRPTISPLTQPLVQPLVRPLTQPLVQPLVRPLTQPLVQPLTQPGIQTNTEQGQIIPGIDIGAEMEALGVGIPVATTELVETNKFQEPTAVGVPTINPDPTIPLPSIYVGAGKHVRVLNGRTYLAQ